MRKVKRVNIDNSSEIYLLGSRKEKQYLERDVRSRGNIYIYNFRMDNIKSCF